MSWLYAAAVFAGIALLFVGLLLDPTARDPVTGALLGGFAALSALFAWRLAQARLVVDSAGLHVRGPLSRWFVPWSALRGIKLEENAGEGAESLRLVLLTADGRVPLDAVQSPIRFLVGKERNREKVRSVQITREVEQFLAERRTSEEASKEARVTRRGAAQWIHRLRNRMPYPASGQGSGRHRAARHDPPQSDSSP